MDMLFAEGSAAQFAFALGAAIVSFFLIRQSRRYFARVAAKRVPERDRETTRAATLASTSEVMRGQVQLEETARDLMGELNSKMSALQALIQLADAAAERLETAADRAERLGIAPHGDTLREIAELPAMDLDGANRLIENLQSHPEAAHRLDAQHHLPAVLHLARSGKSRDAIASELGIPVGEVEMLLSLYGS